LISIGHGVDYPIDFNWYPDHAFYNDITGGNPGYNYGSINSLTAPATWALDRMGIGADPSELSQTNVLYPITFAYHVAGRRVPASRVITSSDPGKGSR
jgi:hypothetical protein